MDIPINAKVFCQDKFCGYTQAVILNPENDAITHVVVKESKKPHTERLVPIGMIDASLSHNVHLKFNEASLQSLPPFFDVEYIQTNVPHYERAYNISDVSPVVVPEREVIEERIYHIPLGEFTVDQGTTVYSEDGVNIGKVDEFLVGQKGTITHLILREGHIFGQKDVFIPVADIASVKEDSLHLKLDKEKVEKLPAIPV